MKKSRPNIKVFDIIGIIKLFLVYILIIFKISLSRVRNENTLIVVVLCAFIVFPVFLFARGDQEKEQRITAYTTLDEEPAVEVFKAFTKETGIPVDCVRLSTGECVAIMEAEKENPQASIGETTIAIGYSP